MKIFASMILTLTLVFCLAGCGDETPSLDKTLDTLETALENCDTAAIMKLMHKEADSIVYGQVEEYDGYEEYLDDFFYEIKEDGDVFDYKLSNYNNKNSDWDDCLEDVKEIIEDEDLNINVEDLTLCEIEVYVDDESYDDGIVIFALESGKWQIVTLMPTC